MSGGEKKIENTEKHIENNQPAARDTSGDAIKTLPDAQKQEREANDTKLQERLRSEKNASEAKDAGYAAAGTPEKIGKQLLATMEKPKDPTLKNEGDKLSFQTSDGKGIYKGPDFLGKQPNDGGVKPAETLKVGDNPLKPTEAKSEKGKPGDNSVREVNPATDNPKAVAERYDKMVDGLNLKPSESARLKKEFTDNMAKMQERFKGQDLSEVMRSANLMMDKDNHLLNDRNRVNDVSGLVARGADPEKANRQGANPTCALTSESRVAQERDFKEWANAMGSAAAKGGAWMGGKNGTEPTWVDVDAKGTNHANFTADNESSWMYSKDIHQTQGHRDYTGQISDALYGGQISQMAGKRDGKDYVYVSANSQMVDGAANRGQDNAGNTMMERAKDGTLRQSMDGKQPADAPPTTPDMVAKMNHANGTGGIFVQANMADKYRDKDGKLPDGMNSFTDAADLRKQLKDHPGQEFQILTNGVMVAGKEGHGLHAQTVKYTEPTAEQAKQGKDGNLVFGNNWEDKANNKVYSDDFVNKFTNPKEWNNYQPSHFHQDGSPDWHREKIGPNTTNVDAGGTKMDKSEDAKKKSDQDKDEEDKAAKQREKNEKDQQEKNNKDKNQKHAAAQALHAQQRAEYDARQKAFEAAKASGQIPKDAQFGEAPPPDVSDA